MTAERRGQRKRGSTDRAGRAGVDLAPDLQTDEEEKYRHQSIVDPELQVALKPMRTDPETDRRVPETGIHAVRGGVGPHNGGDTGKDEYDSAGGLYLKKALDGSQNLPNPGVDGRP
jgi:hypothetical protein